MLQIILILLGLATPNSDVHTHNTCGSQTEVSQNSNSTDQNADSSQDDDTGGETQLPPKK